MVSGHYAAYVTGESGNGAVLSLYNAVTQATVEVANNVSYYYDDRPSTDGDYLVYNGWDTNDWEIYAYKFSTGKTTRLTDNDLDDR